MSLKGKIVMELLERFDPKFGRMTIGNPKDPWAIIEEVQIHDGNITLITTKGIARILVDTRA